MNKGVYTAAGLEESCSNAKSSKKRQQGVPGRALTVLRAERLNGKMNGRPRLALLYTTLPATGHISLQLRRRPVYFGRYLSAWPDCAVRLWAWGPTHCREMETKR